MIVDLAFSRRDPVCRSASGRAVAVVDVIRATTTIATALHHGCAGVVPVLTLKEARGLARVLGADALLAGERGAAKAAGFELGNSPAEYGRERVEGKVIVLTTTNGTRAFRAVEHAHALIAAGFLNVSAAARWLGRADRDLLIVCAGKHGRFCLEDAVAAGMLVDQLLDLCARPVELSDAAVAARQLFSVNRHDLLGMLRGCEWGKEIVRRGFEADLAICAQVNAIDVVPVMREGRLIAEHA